MDLETKKLKLQVMKQETNILEYEVKIEERKEDIVRIEKQIEICKQAKEETEKKLKNKGDK